MKTHVFYRSLAIALLLTPLNALADSQFYRALADNNEPRAELDWLTTFRASIMGGMASKGFGADKHSTDPLQIYGSNKIGLLAADAVGNPSTLIASADLAALLINAPSATLTYSGKFNFFETHFDIEQNIVNGFFARLHIPVKRLVTKNVMVTDSTTGLDANVAEWLTVKNSFATIISAYGLTANDVTKAGIGDIVIGGGWTYNNDSMDKIDFFDTTIRVGVSTPTAEKRDEDKAFSLPLGYNGHMGLPVSFDFALGLFDWVTFGAHVDATFFFKKTVNIRMNTNANQNGYIKLLKGDAKRELGHIFNAGSFLKLDHVFKGLSFSVGYNYAHKDKDQLTPADLTAFTVTAANADCMLKSWNMHVIHTSVEYDFARDGHVCNPAVSVYYARPVAGKRVLQTNTIGGSLGVNLAWNF